MSWLEDIAIGRRLRPRVVHRLPGRLRLHVPLLTDLPDDWLEVATSVERIVASANGVRRVRADRRTGSLLIAYDPTALGEADVLGYLRSLLGLLGRHRHRFAGLSNGRVTRVGRRLERWVADHTRRRPVLDATMDIPDDVWT